MSERLEILLWLAAALAAVGVSALSSGVETGVYCLNRVRLRLRSEAGDPRARVLARLLRDQRSLIGTLLISNNIANYLGSSAVVVLCSFTSLAQWQIAVVVPIIAAPLLLVFGEIVPKNIFQAYSDRYTYAFARPLRWIRRLFQIVGLLPLVNGAAGVLMRLTHRQIADPATDALFHPRQQVGRMLRESSHLGTLSAYQSYLVDRVMNLRNVKVAQVMAPLARVRAVPADITVAEFRRRVAAHQFSRVPAYRDRLSNVVGIADVVGILSSARPGPSIAGLLLQPIRLKPDSPIVHALFTLQRAGQAMGVVADRGGAAVGVVTIKDLIEEIIGEIEER